MKYFKINNFNIKTFLKISIPKILIIFFVITLDLITKQYFYKTNYQIIPYLIGFREVSGLNTGGAWSIFSSSTWLLITITIVALIAFCVFDIFYYKNNFLYSIAISFLVGGAVGNLVDRIALGGVRDFIYFPFMQNFPTFNIADTFIFLGTFLLFIYVLLQFRPQKNKTTEINN